MDLEVVSLLFSLKVNNSEGQSPSPQTTAPPAETQITSSSVDLVGSAPKSKERQSRAKLDRRARKESWRAKKKRDSTPETTPALTPGTTSDSENNSSNNPKKGFTNGSSSGSSRGSDHARPSNYTLNRHISTSSRSYTHERASFEAQSPQSAGNGRVYDTGDVRSRHS